jgi:hypothetical protein
MNTVCHCDWIATRIIISNRIASPRNLTAAGNVVRLSLKIVKFHVVENEQIKPRTQHGRNKLG